MTGETDPTGCPAAGLSRRALLRGGAAGGLTLAGGSLLGACAAGSSEATEDPGPSPEQPARFVDFAGVHQTGITLVPSPQAGLMASFRVVAKDRAALARMFADLTDEARALMAGRLPAARDRAYPPRGSGILGDDPPPDDLTVVVSVGASLFDDRFGLADRRPRELVEMPFLANDRLDPERSHGDVLLSLEAGHRDTLLFALRQLMRATRGSLVLAWMTEGYTRGSTPAEAGAPRNLLGFKDGTANLDATDAEVMDRHVWVADGDGEPAWAVGGSYHVVRLIRMFVEFWDRTPLAEQEALFGRHKISGAPLSGGDEDTPPDYRSDPDGHETPLDAHIRLANPRTPETRSSLILRRGFSFSRGFDDAGRLDQGLAFACFQRSLDAGFLAVQGRLTGEPLEEYILPEGGGFFFALPGVTDPSAHLGTALLA